MQRYEYRVVPAPRKGEKARGLKTLEERFAHSLAGLMNKMGAEGWEYQRADTLPMDERVGLTGSKTTFQNMLVFRRALPDIGCEFLDTTRETPHYPLPEAAAVAPAPVVPTLGAAVQPIGAAPALGPANPDLAAE